MGLRTRKPKPAWVGMKKRPPLTQNICVHCGGRLQQWEILRNAFYHAACLLKIKRANL